MTMSGARPRLSRRTFICPRCLHRSLNTGAARGPLRLGIVGSGPAGFYAAARVLQRLPDARIDMFEKLPVPFGLVRYGVAPDHPEVKNCQDRFEEVASSNRFRFIGNAHVGSSIPLSKLKQHYNALLFAYGAAEDRLLGIPGEYLPGVYSAREFVGWYNGLPQYRHLEPNLDSENAVVIGNGNVALDVARVLLTDVKDLQKTDMSREAIAGLSKSRVKHVTVAGRRGPMQAAFTIKEVRELMRLQSTSFQMPDTDLLPTASYISGLPRLEQRKYRLGQLISDEAKASTTRNVQEKSWSLRSLLSPTEFHNVGQGDDRLQKVAFTVNEYSNSNAKFDRNAEILSTNGRKEFETSLAFRSIGYKSVGIAGLNEDLGVYFDQRRGVIVNDRLGRALSSEQKIVPGIYCAGWVKNGPTGVIATTMEDAFATAEAITEDWDSSKPFLQQGDMVEDGWESLRDEVKLDQPVHWADWKKIDKVETEKGQKLNKPREKFTDIYKMLEVASS